MSRPTHETVTSQQAQAYRVETQAAPTAAEPARIGNPTLKEPGRPGAKQQPRTSGADTLPQRAIPAPTTETPTITDLRPLARPLTPSSQKEERPAAPPQQEQQEAEKIEIR